MCCTGLKPLEQAPVVCLGVGVVELWQVVLVFGELFQPWSPPVGMVPSLLWSCATCHGVCMQEHTWVPKMPPKQAPTHRHVTDGMGAEVCEGVL